MIHNTFHHSLFDQDFFRQLDQLLSHRREKIRVEEADDVQLIRGALEDPKSIVVQIEGRHLLKALVEDAQLLVLLLLDVQFISQSWDITEVCIVVLVHVKEIFAYPMIEDGP